MSFNHIVLQNILRDKKTYISYFLSSVFSILVFFLFMLIAQHPSLKIIEAASTIGFMMMLVNMFIYLFSFIFIMYSLFAFLKKKTKSLGIFMITGASMKQIRTLVFRENMIIGFVAIVTAIIIGLVIGPLFLMIAKNVMGTAEFGMYVPIMPILITVVLFTVLFFIISKFMTRFINKEQAVYLLKADVTQEKPIKKNVFVAVASFFAMLVFGGLDYITSTKMHVPDVVSLLITLVFFGLIILTIYFFIMQVLRLKIISWSKGRNYLSSTNMLFASNMKAKGKSHGNIMFLLTLLLLGVFVCSSTLFSSFYNTKKKSEQLYPYSFQYISYPENSTEQQDIGKLTAMLDEHGDYQAYESALKNVESEQRIGILSESGYNALGKNKPIALGEDEYYIVSGSGGVEPTIFPENLKDVEGLTQAGTILENPLSEGFQSFYLVVPEELYKSLPYKENHIFAFEVKDWTNQIELANTVFDKIDIDYDRFSFTSKITLYQSEKMNGSILMFIGAMLSLIFISAATSILYFYLQTTIEAEKGKYAGIRKVGLSMKELSSVIKKELAILLFTPFFIALMLLGGGFIAFSSMITAPFLLLMGLSTAVYFLLFIVGYIVIHKMYMKNIMAG